MKEGYTTREIQAQTQMDIISGYYRKIGLTPGITIEDILQILEADLQYIRESNAVISVEKIINSASLRTFTLKEALELWECGYDNGWIDGTEADTHMGDHNDDTFNMLKKRQYFKDKFGIDI